MQDRFKFRVFEKTTKTMKELNAFGYSDFDPLGKGISRLIMIPAGIDNTYAYNKTCLYNPENFFEPMQCTGLKDKNGKLVLSGPANGTKELIHQLFQKNYFIVFRHVLKNLTEQKNTTLNLLIQV